MRIYKLLNNFLVKLIIEIIATELNLLKQMNSFLGIYERLTRNDTKFAENISKTLTKYVHQYKHMFVVGEFNLTVDSPH